MGSDRESAIRLSEMSRGSGMDSKVHQGGNALNFDNLITVEVKDLPR